MKLDLRRPTFVLVGAWNPAIFQPGWIAQHLLDVPSGSKIRAVQVVDVQNSRGAMYFGHVGVAVSAQRLEIYANEGERETYSACESAIRNAVNTLPHTPIHALGVNFHFEEEELTDEVVDALKTHEKTYELYQISGEVIKSGIKLEDDNAILQFSRGFDGTRTFFDFNYHSENLAVETLQDSLTGIVEKRLRHALSVLEQLYDLTGYDVSNHELSEAGGEDEQD